MYPFWILTTFYYFAHIGYYNTTNYDICTSYAHTFHQRQFVINYYFDSFIIKHIIAVIIIVSPVVLRTYEYLLVYLK